MNTTAFHAKRVRMLTVRKNPERILIIGGDFLFLIVLEILAVIRIDRFWRKCRSLTNSEDWCTMEVQINNDGGKFHTIIRKIAMFHSTKKFSASLLSGLGLLLTFFAVPGWGAETTYENLTGSNDITIASGDTGIAATSNSAFTGNWIVNGTLQSKNADIETPDRALGSGKVILNNGATLLSGVQPTRIYSTLETNGNVTFGGGNQELHIYGNITGSGAIMRTTYWSVFLNGDNSAYTGDWNLNADWTWSRNEWSEKQDSWAGSGDYTFGSGTITLNGGGIAFANADKDYHVWNDLVINQTRLNFMKGGKSVTLSGKLSGAGDIRLQTAGTEENPVYSTYAVHVRGKENGEFSGDWTIDEGYTLTTNNYGASKEISEVGGGG